MTTATIERYRDVEGDWRWRLLAPDGHPLADGSRGFAGAADLAEHLGRIRAVVPEAVVVAADAGCILVETDGVVVYDRHGRRRLSASDADAVSTDGPDAGPGGTGWREHDGDARPWARTRWGSLPVREAGVGGFLCHRGADDEWRWLLRLDGDHVADSGEGYAGIEAARAAARRARAALPRASERTWGAGQNA